MLYRIVASTRPYFATIAKLSVRDIELKVAALFLLCALCWHLGHPVAATVVGLMALVTEAILRLMFNHKWVFTDWDKGQMILLALVILPLNAVLYSVLALYLATDPSIAIKISGMIFVMGIQVYVANSWSSVPVFIYATLLPAMMMLALTFLQLSATPPVPSTMTHWAFAMSVLFLFIYASIDTLHSQLRTQLDLFDTRIESDTRLAQLEDAQRQDGLTGVLNRGAFNRALSVMLEDCTASGCDVAVFFLDLDSFKPINDTYSHAAGDEVLRITGARIAGLVGQSGIVGRLGGDEFICAVLELDGDPSVLDFGSALAKSIANPIRWNDRKLKITTSIGVAGTHAGTLHTATELCAAADQALTLAKTETHRRPILYHKDLFAPRMSALEKQQLVDGLSDGSVRPYYQPKINLPTGQVIGFEALARWEHEDTTPRRPDDFIEQINELGLQADFMTTMANQVIADIKQMLGLGLDPGQVSLNVSEVALATHSGKRDLLTLLKQNPEAVKHLTFEITEDVFIGRAAGTVQASIASFRAQGVRISLDDFGTGFASFHHLRQLEFDELKIDTSFVADLGQDASADVLVRGFLDIASGLGVSVVAEGVETENQRRDLINMGCVIAQGYLFGAALPASDVHSLLTDKKAG